MISGQKVTLRALRHDDVDAMYALSADLDTWEERNEQPPVPLTRERFTEQFTELLAAKGDELTLAIQANDHLVGRCNLFSVDLLTRDAEVGLIIAADARGKGYGTDALRTLVEFAFVRRNLRRVHLITLASNVAAQRSYTKVGYVVEGRAREAAWVRGEYIDIVQMGLLRSEWAAPR